MPNYTSRFNLSKPLTTENYDIAKVTNENADKLDASATQLLTTTETITVGTGGQYATINQALAYATKKYPTYVSASTRPRITISLLSGFVMAEQVIVDGIDLSWITISSVSTEVVITRSALTIANADSSYPAFTAQNGAFLPIINTLFNMDTSGTATNRHGIHAFNNSKAIINSGKGVKNAGTYGIYANRGSTINAYEANASGAGDIGIYAFRGSTINAYGANARKGASDSGSDFSVYDGSFIAKKAGTGGVSQTEGKWTSNGLIVGSGVITTDGSLPLTGGTLTGALNVTTIATSSHIVGQHLKIRGDALEEYKTDGEAQVSINYWGYNSGTTQFRNFGIYDGKASLVARFLGSDKSTILYGALNTNGQIKFPATQNPSADANTLDDYEEGAFTPTITSSGGTFTTVSSNIRYIKIGKLVTCYGAITITNAGNATGAILVTTPFPIAIPSTAGIGYEANTGAGNCGVFAFQGSGLEIRKYDGTTIIANGRVVAFSVTYGTN